MKESDFSALRTRFRDFVGRFSDFVAQKSRHSQVYMETNLH